MGVEAASAELLKEYELWMGIEAIEVVSAMDRLPVVS